jgi:hypothetical protein
MNLKSYLKNVFLLLVCLTIAKTTIAQSNKLSISVTVKDSLTKNSLNNATVGIYNAANGSLLANTLANKEGIFTIPQLSVAATLQLRVTHVGYKTYKKNFNLQSKKNTYNFGPILLCSESPRTNTLETVEVFGANKNAATILGSIKGKVKDSTYKYVLSTATVSVYKVADSNLLQFNIPNNLGEFTLQKLPVNIPLKLLITHVGYTPYERIFNLDTDSKDFGWIYMHQNADKENNLKEVEITSYAPVRMNGDTLEFNPRAFKMDPNATTEDLMRRLPGMVVWGDGDITFNGKKINSLLVDGKPFMGSSDFTTASQNLPKDVLDKVQIYSQRNEKNPLDSTLNANLKLKEDKKMGYFGKVAAGYGSKNRFATDGMLNGYNKKAQIVTVGAFNNINKSASDINTLIRNNSYKGEGNNIDYQSDFKKAGINISTTAGTRFQYDFIADVSDKKSRRLTADYFFKRNNETINSTRLMNTLLKADSILSSNNTNESTNIMTNNVLSANYTQQEKDFRFTISADANINESNNTSESKGTQTRTGTIGQLSRSNSLNNYDNVKKRMALDAQFYYQREIFDDDTARKRRKHLEANFTIGYKFEYEESKGNRHTLSSILSTLNPDANKLFDRLYQHHHTGNGHIINIAYPNLKKLIFGFANLGGINLDLSSQFTFNQQNTYAMVFDTGVQTLQYEKNRDLTNNRVENVQDIKPQLTISKNFYKGLTNRYSQRLDVFVIPKIQYYGMQSLATQQLQNFSYQYQKFIPNASLSYNNHQYGNYELMTDLNYRSNVDYPTTEHIAPLVDSANVWYISKGNLNIKPEYTNTFAWKISIESRKPKNPYQIDFSIDGNFTKNKISDSTFYDNIGRRINYNINLNGNKYWHLGSYYRKAYSPNKSNTFRLNIWYNHYRYYIPQYLDALLITSSNRNNNYDIEIAYSFLDIVNLNAKQGFSFYKNLQSSNNQQYNGLNNYTRFSGTLQLPKNLTWSSNVNFNTNKAENQATVHYTIWNASLAYRFMQGNSGEVKFSALDLLKQNKGVINNTNRNVQTFGFNNVLQQYFMLSLAYYPRKFGK